MKALGGRGILFFLGVLTLASRACGFELAFPVSFRAGTMRVSCSSGISCISTGAAITSLQNCQHYVSDSQNSSNLLIASCQYRNAFLADGSCEGFWHTYGRPALTIDVLLIHIP